MSGWVTIRILLIHKSYHIKQWQDTVAWKHKGCEGATNSYDRNSIKPQQISWKDRVFVTFGGGLEDAGGSKRSLTPKYCLSSFQCFFLSSWCSLLTEKMCVNVQYKDQMYDKSTVFLLVWLCVHSLPWLYISPSIQSHSDVKDAIIV